MVGAMYGGHEGVDQPRERRDLVAQRPELRPEEHVRDLATFRVSGQPLLTETGFSNILVFSKKFLHLVAQRAELPTRRARPRSV